MQTEYTLYLDESADKNKGILCVAGFIINNTDIPKLDEKILEIKKEIWSDDDIEQKKPILHSTELNVIYNNRGNNQKANFTKGNYKVFNKLEKSQIETIYKNVYTKMSCIFKEIDIVTLCCIIDINKYKSYCALTSEPRLIDDWYDIAMQEIIESYTHFLCVRKGVGSIVYEARSQDSLNANESPDNKMFHNFCKIKVNGKGISSLTNRTIYDRLRFLHIISKKENKSGLQLADFIAFNFFKCHLRNDDDQTEFMKKIYLAAYNSSYNISDRDMRSYWGVKKLPVDVCLNEERVVELKKLKKAYANLKLERNRILKKNEQIINEKRELQKKFDELKAKYAEIIQ